jgi:L-threonylcarbamoyladenylate synthase
MKNVPTEKAIQILRQGGVVAHPTDTCYGLAADVFNPQALERLYELKGMPKDKPVSILVSSLEEAKRYAYFSSKALELAERFWPGALTLVLRRSENLPIFLNPEVSEIGLRVIDEPTSVGLLKAFGGPLTTTSANAHRKPSPDSVREISVQPDLILDRGELQAQAKPSTIVRVVGDGIEILRQGDLKILK